MNEELLKYLKENLKVELNVEYGVKSEYGNKYRNILEVKLLLNDEVISKDYETLENIRDE